MEICMLVKKKLLYLCENKLLTTAFINTILSTYQTTERINDMNKPLTQEVFKDTPEWVKMY